MDAQEIEVIAQLSNITLTDAQKQHLARSIDEMLEYFSHMSSFTGEHMDAPAAPRALDEVCAKVRTPVISDQDYAECSPEEESGFFVVPHVI